MIEEMIMGGAITIYLIGVAVTFVIMARRDRGKPPDLVGGPDMALMVAIAWPVLAIANAFIKLHQGYQRTIRWLYLKASKD